MATLLHIDTALEEAIVCISNNGILIGCLKNNNQQSHASFLQPAIKKLLQQHKISLSSINAVAVTLGPGSYTGIRVGLASAKGLCFALDKPLIGISTLQVLAQQSIINTKTENDNVLYIPMIDARRMEVFTAIYNSSLQEILTTQAMILDENSFESFAINSQIICMGSGAIKFRSIAKHSNFSFMESIDYTQAFVQLTYQQFLNKQFLDVSNSVPMYVKQVFTTASKK